MVSENTPVKNLLKSQKSQDTVFEAWMFMEFFDYFVKEGFAPMLNLDSKPYNFEFTFQGRKVTFWYEREFMATGKYAWALQQKPDFTVMVDDNIVGVFDAKNFSAGQHPSPAINKILSYMMNFNSKFGILFFPYIPEFWDEWSKDKKKKEMFEIYSKENPSKTIENDR